MCCSEWATSRKTPLSLNNQSVNLLDSKRQEKNWGAKQEGGCRTQGPPSQPFCASPALPQADIWTHLFSVQNSWESNPGKNSFLALPHPSLSSLFCFCFCIVMSPFLTFRLLVSVSGEVTGLPHPGQCAWEEGEGQVQVKSPQGPRKAQDELGRRLCLKRGEVLLLQCQTTAQRRNWTLTCASKSVTEHQPYLMWIINVELSCQGGRKGMC
jgi:hypothetical protein